MRNKLACLLLVALAACKGANPAEVRTQAKQFQLRAEWSAAVAPVGTATVAANVAIKEYLGSRMEATVTLNGAGPNAVYQWRIFRGDCATTTAAASNTAATGLLLVATAQSYPDLAANASGTVTLTRSISGVLDSLTAYSVRLRPAQQATNWNGTNPIACGNLRPLAYALLRRARR
jgi:hypothetical protein